MNTAPVPLAYLVSRYPAVSHTFILREILQLRELGHAIHTASINPPDRTLALMDMTESQEALGTYCVKSDLPIGAPAALVHWLLRAPASLWRTLKQGAAGWGIGRGLAYAIEAAMVARWMHKMKLRHLHVHFGNAGASVGVLVKALTGCHLSFTIHGPDEFDDVIGQQLRLKMHAADLVVCISQFARSQLMRISDPNDWSKFRVCRLGVNPGQFRYTAPSGEFSKLRMLCIGRLTPAKGQVLLVQACSLLRDAGVDFSLTMIGEGPDRARIEAAIAERQLGECISLAGALNQTEVRDALARADVFVLPSFAEGIPVVLMEAMSSGVPCVSSPVNGIPELIEHGISGLLATPGDVDALAAQLTRLVGDVQLRQQLAQAARAKVEQAFDLAHNVRQLSKIFAGFPLVPTGDAE